MRQLQDAAQGSLDSRTAANANHGYAVRRPLRNITCSVSFVENQLADEVNSLSEGLCRVRAHLDSVAYNQCS